MVTQVSLSFGIEAELARAYHVFNEWIFSDKLPEIQFEFQPINRWCMRYVQEYNHIIIGSSIVDKRVDDILGHLLHEMCHVYNVQRHVDDVTSNHYHNRKFMTVAVVAGLYVERIKTHGWSKTTLTPPSCDPEDLAMPMEHAVSRRTTAFEKVNFDEGVLRMAQESVLDLHQNKPSKVYSMKYHCACPPPYNSIRSGRRPNGPNRLYIICQVCKKPFVPA